MEEGVGGVRELIIRILERSAPRRRRDNGNAFYLSEQRVLLDAACGCCSHPHHTFFIFITYLTLECLRGPGKTVKASVNASRHPSRVE